MSDSTGSPMTQQQHAIRDFMYELANCAAVTALREADVITHPVSDQWIGSAIREALALVDTKAAQPLDHWRMIVYTATCFVSCVRLRRPPGSLNRAWIDLLWSLNHAGIAIVGERTTLDPVVMHDNLVCDFETLAEVLRKHPHITLTPHEQESLDRLSRVFDRDSGDSA